MAEEEYQGMVWTGGGSRAEEKIAESDIKGKECGVLEPCRELPKGPHLRDMSYETFIFLKKERE